MSMISALLTTVTRRERWFVLILFAGAFLLRILYLFEISHQPLFTYLVSDAEFHDSWAQSIANGNLLGNSVFFRAPLYPYFLGCIYWIAGHNDIVARVVQHFLGSAGVVLL